MQRANWITPTIRDITLQLPQDETWDAGQYALVRVALRVAPLFHRPPHPGKPCAYS